MNEILVSNKTVSQILLNEEKITLSSAIKLYEGMRVKIYCVGTAGKTYLTGIISKIHERKKNEYTISLSADLVLF